MTKDEHKDRHRLLHLSLDELIHDYITHTNKAPNDITLLQFLNWSFTETLNPTEPGGNHESKDD